MRLTHINSALVSAQNRERFYVTNFGNIEQPQDREILLRDVLESGKDLSCREKAYTLTASYGGAVAWNTLEKNQRTMVAEPVFPLKSGKARCVTAGYANKGAAHILESYYSLNPSKQKWDSVAEPVAIPLNTTIDGKAQALRATCYKDGVRNLVGNDVDKRTAIAKPVKFEGIVPTKAVSCADGKVYSVYEVRDGLITIKDKQYPIELADGYYIIRKLTPLECERLQTMPDGYTAAVSNSQRYKALGNGWTAEVIIHILNHVLKDVPRDEELVVLSMYDGIATGRYCLDKMGFTNVKYYAYEIDPYPIKIAMSNYPDIIQCGDAFRVRDDDWKIPD